MSSKTLFLICNAHLDPVWLWEWEEGAAEALSTFRQAAEFCEKFEEFVFNHNEAVLYQWVEEYEPELFSKIQRLVKKKKWHIMGGWFLQPDCNLPSGESFVRQILMGRNYFKKKFGVELKTAINFDAFGHTRGLVQVLKKSGYDSYIFCRPDTAWLSLPADDFIWVGYDGSEIIAHRARAHYNSSKGKSAERVKQWMAANSECETSMLLWGIGNHGGGASQEDLRHLRTLMKEERDWSIRHAVPEDYFKALSLKVDDLPQYARDLNPWAVGCYTTMARIKQKHRQLENSFFLTEKMVTHAALQGFLDYPQEQLQEALEDLLFCQFHDILPGSSIPQVEEYALQRIGHGLEILSRLRAKAFFALLGGQPKAKGGEFPIFVYNPHPYPVEEIISCEFQPHEINYESNTHWVPLVRDNNGRPLPCQTEKESSYLSVEWRKKVVFQALLKPAQMNRFTSWLKKVERRPEVRVPKEKFLMFKSNAYQIIINTQTGLLEKYEINGVNFLQPNAFRALVVEDYPDSWGMRVRSFRNVLGAFTLMSKGESARFAGVRSSVLDPVRIIEEGPVRTVVEALFKHNHSSLCLRYKIPKKGTVLEVEVRVFWNEKDRMLKLSLPTPFRDGRYKGQVAYGVEDFDRTGEELVAQKWIGIFSPDQKRALTVITNRTYGFDYDKGELRVSLLRSPAYSADTPGEDMALVCQDRFVPRIDQGEKVFHFWVNGGSALSRMSGIDRQALFKNESPVVLSCFPPGRGKKPLPSILLSDKVIQVAALKMAESRDSLIIRLFEPTGRKRKTCVAIPSLKLSFGVSLRAFEIKTMAVNLATKEIFEVDLMERRI